MNRHQLVKRGVDLLVAWIVLIVALPFMAVIAALIWILEGRPIFYISKRHVTVNHQIPIIKFRTMVRDAKSPHHRLQERFMRDGYLDIPRNCEVYTPVGRLLERTQIVELPQLLNVIFHGMSLIGNRPLPADNVRILQSHPDWQARFDSPAGITGIAQVVGKLQLTPRQRLDLEGAYSAMYQTGSVSAADLRIALQTVFVILFSKSMTIEDAYALIGSPSRTRKGAISVSDKPDAHYLGRNGPLQGSGAPIKLLVLGASSAIGSEIAGRFASGNSLLLVGRNPELLDDTANHCRQNGAVHVETLEADLCSNFAEIQWAALNGEFDIVLNAACSTSRLRDDDIDLDELQAHVAVDLLAPVELIRSMARRNRKTPLRVIFVSSLLANVRSPRRLVYGSLKSMQELVLRKLSKSEPALKTLIVRVSVSMPPSKRTAQSLQLARAVHAAFARGDQELSFGTMGRILGWLYLAQPLVFNVVVELSRKVRSPLQVSRNIQPAVTGQPTSGVARH